jgi:hypothetical protein
MLRDTAMTGTEPQVGEVAEEGEQHGGDVLLQRRLLRAVEQYKAACWAEGEEPTEEDAWLVFLAALQFEDDK